MTIDKAQIDLKDQALQEIQRLIDEGLASCPSVPFDMNAFIAERKAAIDANQSLEVWVDPEDAPELDDEFFAHADEYRGETLVRRGGLRLAKPYE